MADMGNWTFYVDRHMMRICKARGINLSKTCNHYFTQLANEKAIDMEIVELKEKIIRLEVMQGAMVDTDAEFLKLYDKIIKTYGEKIKGKPLGHHIYDWLHGWYEDFDVKLSKKAVFEKLSKHNKKQVPNIKPVKEIIRARKNPDGSILTISEQERRRKETGGDHE